MASTIKIKRSGLTGVPAGLAAGELAYSWKSDSNKLYIGTGTETDGVAANIDVIGGKYFTDLLDHTAGTLTASSAILVDSNSKINEFYVDNLKLDGSTLSSTNENGDINITPDGTGKTVITNLFIGTDSLTEFIQDVTGGAIAAGNGIDLAYNDELGTTTVSLNTEYTQDLVGAMVSGTGADQTNISVTYDDTNGKLDFAVATASSSVLGVASFSTASFDVTAGAVTIKTAGVSNSQLANSSVTVGTTTISLGGTSTTLAGLTQLDVDNLRLDGNTLSTTNTNGDLVLNPNGTGKVSIANAYTLPRVDGTNGQILVTNGSGVLAFQSPAPSSFTIAGNTGTDTFSTGETLTFTGTASIVTAVTDNTVTISASDATTSTKGVASFSSASFDVTTGAVSIKNAGVSNSQLANSSVTIGSTSVSLGSTVTAFSGLTELTVDNIKLDATTISAVGVADDISIELEPKGTGTVDVSGARISSVGEPTQASDAATKQYVDAVAEGLHVHAGVDAATNNTLATLSGGTVTYNNGTAGVGATLTLEIGLSTLDGYTLQNGDRILVKNETNAAHNGIYIRTSSTILTRATDYDTAAEIVAGDFIFVSNGTAYNSTGWVQINDVTTVGTDNISWQQFSGAGTYLAGDGLSLNGNEFDVNLATTGGLEFSGANAIQLKSGVAGDGLTLTEGVIDVVGTANRISVSANAVDISTSYVGQSSITTLGTITSGTWNGTAIGTAYGGTGLTSYATGDLVYASTTNTLAKLAAGVEGKVLQMGGAGVPVWGDIDGGTY